MELFIPNTDRLSYEFSDEPNLATVEMLSIYGCPNCSSRGTGTAVGKLEQLQITNSTDDGNWQYNGVFSDTVVVFGDSTPVV